MRKLAVVMFSFAAAIAIAVYLLPMIWRLFLREYSPLLERLLF